MYLDETSNLPTTTTTTTTCSNVIRSIENCSCSLEVGANDCEMIEKCYQSPINICKRSINVLERCYTLKWKRYEEIPVQIMLKNDGSTIVLTCDYGRKSPPSITQIDQELDEYLFKYIKFRFGTSNADGSEHMIDYRKYPMEIQVTHETRPKRKKTKTLVLSYFFNIVPYDNLYLDPIIRSLAAIQRSNAEMIIVENTFPLSYLLPSFETGYFSYVGTLTEPPYTENVFWIIQPEPLAVSERQMQCFRRMIVQNFFTSFHCSRPVQNVNMRNIFYNIPQRCPENFDLL